MFWLILSILVGAGFYYAFIKRYYHWKERGVPQYPIWKCWVENASGIFQLKAITDTIKDSYDHFISYRYYGVYQFLQGTLVIKDRDLLKQILVKDFDHFVDHFRFVPEDTEPLWEKNLFFLRGDRWKDMRATLSPSFTSSKMRAMFGVISECSEKFVQYFEEKRTNLIELEMKDAFTRFTNDVIASSAFGITCDSMRNPNNEFYLMGKKITNFTGFWNGFKFCLLIFLPKFAKAVGISFFDQITSSFFTKLVKENIDYREKHNVVRSDMIQLLLDARNERTKEEEPSESVEKRPKEKLTDTDITAQALIFFFAGFDSVAMLMCFMAYELAVNPDIQQRLQSEIADIDEVTYEAILKMKYMDMVISESLRKWPGAVATDRVCVKPYTIEPVRKGEVPIHLKKGDVIMIPIYGVHHDPAIYPDPSRFDPERFNEENRKNIDPYSFLAFGTGPRNCIGNRFALMETKLVFYYLLKKFTIVVVDKTTVPLELETSQIQLMAKGGFWLGLKSRDF